MKSAHSLMIVLLVLLATACGTREEKKEDPLNGTEIIPVKVMSLQKENLKAVIHTSGLFTTDDETMLAFKTGGVIGKIYVKEGDPIRKGQLLASLHLTEIEAQVAQARLGYEKARRDFQRVENLYRDSVATLEQFQNAKTGMEVAAQQLEAVNFNRSYSEIRALGNGFVLRKLANEGQVISSGTQVFQTNGAGQGKWMLRAGVSDREWAQISLGDKATITTDALPNQVLDATVTRKSEGADGMNGSFAIELTIKTSKGLASGLYGNVIILASAQQPVWKIPYAALLDGDAQSGYVFVTADGKTAQKVPVVVGAIEKDEVIIVGGLENAQKIIVSGSAYLRDQSAISVIQ
jgi:RND family efflux transporter MFP subunit